MEALVEQVVCLKRLKMSTFGSSEPLHLLRIMDMSAPSLHRESTDSMITAQNFQMQQLQALLDTYTWSMSVSVATW